MTDLRNQTTRTTTTKVGDFEFDPTTGQVAGPAAYMKERGAERIRKIEAGQDTVFNFGLEYNPDPIALALVSLQTDYSAWLGQRQELGRIQTQLDRDQEIADRIRDEQRALYAGARQEA